MTFHANVDAHSHAHVLAHAHPHAHAHLDAHVNADGVRTWAGAYSLTYSYSKGSPLIPDFGLPSQFAIFPGSVTGCISERT